MRAHKHNIEQRQQGENIDNWAYWSQHRDKIQKGRVRQSLDPSWYTDNIYSNQSIDLEKELLPDYRKYDGATHVIQQNYKTSNIDDEILFNLHAKPKTPNMNQQYRYPKSKSCCFGGSFDRPKMIDRIPKSHTFCTARASANFAKIREIKHTYDPNRMHHNHLSHSDRYRTDCSDDPDDFYAMNCDRTKKTAKNPYNEECNALRKRKIEMASNRCKADYTKNDWMQKNNNKKAIIYDKNKNFCDYYANNRKNQRHDQERYLDEEFLCAEEDFDNANNTFDDYDPCAATHGSFNIELDRYLEDSKRSSMMLNDPFDDVFLDDFAFSNQPIRNKSMLEVKPPSRYDETSSDSTDMELDDFNFDFKKYWEELDKTDSFLDDLDHQNNNNYNNLNMNVVKEKNVNIGRYNNGSLIDDSNTERTNARYLLHNSHKNNLHFELPLSPTSSRHGDPNIDFANNTFIPIVPDSPYNRLSRKSHTDRSIYNNFYGHDSTVAASESLPSHQYNPSTSHTNNNTLSLINNIFSIYKPKKYSPVNCRSQSFCVKPEPCKKMNVPSTIRPLGAPHNDFITSLKRPLLVSSSSSSCTDQPNFKIIPQKTGLKISPLYHFDYDSDSKFKLKSTARPLLFPH